jgi:hypothetical protein
MLHELFELQRPPRDTREGRVDPSERVKGKKRPAPSGQNDRAKSKVLFVGSGGGGDTLLAMLAAQAHLLTYATDEVVVLGAGNSLKCYEQYLTNSTPAARSQFVDPKDPSRTLRPGFSDDAMYTYMDRICDPTTIENVIWLKAGVDEKTLTEIDPRINSVQLGHNKYNSLYEESMTRGMFPDLKTVGIIYSVGGANEPKYITTTGETTTSVNFDKECWLSQKAFADCHSQFKFDDIVLIDVGGDITTADINLQKKAASMKKSGFTKPPLPGRDLNVLNAIRRVCAADKGPTLKVMVLGPGADGHDLPQAWHQKNTQRIQLMGNRQTTDLLAVISGFKSVLRNQMPSVYDTVFGDKRATQIFLAANEKNSAVAVCKGLRNRVECSDLTDEQIEQFGTLDQLGMMKNVYFWNPYY